MTVDIPDTGSLTDDVVRNAEEAPDTVLFRRRESGEEWTDITCAEFHEQVRAVAKGLIAAGIEAEERVGLLSRTRYEWTLLDYAIWYAGAATVPIYETSSADQIEWILADSGAVAAIAETSEHVGRISSIRGSVPDLRHLWSIDDNAVDVLTRLGMDVPDSELEARRSAVTPSRIATVIYTSGTTGRPKGCLLTHGNFMYELGVATVELEELFTPENGRQPSTLLFLPLAHVFARIIQVGAVKRRAVIGHTPGIKTLLDDLAALQPSFVLAVPRVFEKVFNTASQKAAADGKGKIFNRATDVAIAWSRAQDTGKVPLPLRLQHAVFSKLVYSKLVATLGGRCRHAISGGAPLGERLAHFYRGIGLTILEGYGLTETTGALTVNTPTAQKIGTVGRPLQGTTVRVADDGELVFHGDQVFHGYWGNDAATADALSEDRWFHSGDLGEVDDEGFVRITGRKKEIIITAGGKNVAPALLEDRLRAHLLVDQCLVVGDGQPFIGALITLDEESLPAWAETAGKPGRTAADLADDPDLLAEIQNAVDDANKAVSKAESIRKFRVLTASWTEEGGQLTPSLKLKRALVSREFRDDIAALYIP